MRIRLIHFALALLLCSLMTPAPGQNQSGFTAGSPTATTTPSAATQREDYDPLLDLPRLPRNQVTLIGGTVISLDEVMNRMVVQPFGGKQKMKIDFDTRTHFYSDRKPITVRQLRQGQRIYLDTMLNGSRVFAKTIWIQTTVESGMSRGQIIDFDPSRRTLAVRDELSDQPLRMILTPTTTVRKGDQPGSLNDLVPGALVGLSFGLQREIQEITLLATPGSTFTFSGRVTYLDLSRKLIAIDNRSDHKKYDVYIEAIAGSILRQLREGVEVNVSAVFDGNRYDARGIDIANANSANEQP
jgi:hypothetical protein